MAASSRPVVATSTAAPGQSRPAGYGVRIEQPDGELIEEFAESIGVATNNVAEYRALIAALEWARRHEVQRLLVRSDSQLLVQQMRELPVKHPGLQPLHARARMVMHELDAVTFEHVRREKNEHADGWPTPLWTTRRSPDRRAMRPAALPSRRYEQRRSGWLAVHRPAR